MKESGFDALLAPLRIRTFRAMWTANIVSNIGTMMQSVGAAWLMTSLTTSTTLVGSVQTAATFPVFLVGLLAGALADLVDRKALLFWSQAWMLCAAGLLGALTLGGMTKPWILLALTFAIGLGSAISLPAWQATVQDIVPREAVASAVSLNSISFNLARAVGPALGGLLVAAAGTAVTFFVNAASFIAVLMAVSSWKPVRKKLTQPREDVAGAIRAGLRYIRHAPRLQSPMIRAAAYVLCAGAVWPLMPLLARDVLKTTATGYGVLLGMFGLGSIGAALIVPRVRKSYPLDWIIGVGTVLFAASLFGVAQVKTPFAAAIALACTGAAWVGVLVNFNVAVQTAVPAWVRGRAISFYLLVFQGMLSLDGLLWGWLAGRLGVQECFMLAGCGLIAGLVLIRAFPLSLYEELDLRPIGTAPELHAGLDADPDDGPVLVQIEYFIEEDAEEAFRGVMLEIREQRLRDGARMWRLYSDARRPDRFVEIFRLDSWGEHLRQHERPTMDDMAMRTRALAFHKGPEPPKVEHFLRIED